MTDGEQDLANRDAVGASGPAASSDIADSGDRVADSRDRKYRHLRRRPAPRAHAFWRFGYPAIIVAAGLAVMLLAREGGKAVLDETTVRIDEEVRLQPHDPGFLEFVAPTPTLLVVHTHQGQLTGISFMARSEVDNSGGIILMSPELLVIPPGGASEDGEFLNAVYSGGGLEALELSVEAMLGLGFDQVLEVAAETMAEMMRRAEPLPYLLSDDLTVIGADGVERVVFEAGRHELSGADAALIYALKNPGEADINRVERQRLLWESWLGVIARSEDLDSVTLPFPEGLWPYVRLLGAGAAAVELVPMSTVALDPSSPPFYVLGEAGGSWLEERAAELVPWPQPPKSLWRPSVQILDGVGEADSRDQRLADVAKDVIRSGGVVTVMGNVKEFGVESTQFAYHRPELLTDELTKILTNGIALELGVKMSYIDLGESVPGLVDITVTVGRDRMAP